MIKFDRVSKRYPNGKDALRRINFELPAGQLTFLTGHSGAGKSTLLKLIMMIERPTQGQVFVEGQNLNGFSTRQVPFLRRKIGMVFQGFNLLVFASLLLLAGWLAAALVLTLFGPFVESGNGFFACWVGVAAAVAFAWEERRG